mgnify:CR=1 FL=1
MKKAIVVAAVCFGIGIAGLAVSLPMAAQDVLDIYNEAVSVAETSYTQQEIPAGVTSLRVVNRDQPGQIFISVLQSTDDKIHLYNYDNPVTGSYEIEISTEGESALVDLHKKSAQRDWLSISRDTLIELLRTELDYQGNLILEVPTNVTLTSSEMDGVYFGVEGGVEFVNAQQIWNYGYVPSENELWKQKFESSQQELHQLQEEYSILQQDNASMQEALDNAYAEQGEQTTVEPAPEVSVQGSDGELVTPAEVLQIEDTKQKRKEEFRNNQREETVSEYLKSLQMLDQMILEKRISQLQYAGRDDLLPLLEEVSAQVTAYDSVEALVLDAQRNYNQGNISQDQYNSIVNSYEETMKTQQATLIEYKAQLSEAGYYWDSAVVASARAQ